MVAINSMQIMVGNNRSYHIDLAGDPANPALLLLHGFTGSRVSWEPLMPAFLPNYRLIAPDLPGHGNSFVSANPEEMTMSVTAQDMKALLLELGIHHAGILGYSMGGRLALHTALYNEGLLDFLILESSTAGIANFEEQMARRQRDNFLADEIESRGLAWFVEYWSNIPLFSTQSRLPSVVIERERKIRLSHAPHGLAQSLRAAGTGSQASLWPILRDCRAPTLIIAGQDDEKFVRIGRQLHEELPFSEFMTINNAGHAVHLEQPEQFLAAVTTFLHTIKVR